MKVAPASNNVIGVPLDEVIDRSTKHTDKDYEEDSQYIRSRNADTLKQLLGDYETVCVSDTPNTMSQAVEIEQILHIVSRRKEYSLGDFRENGYINTVEAIAVAANLISLARVQCQNCLNENCTRRDPEQPTPSITDAERYGVKSFDLVKKQKVLDAADPYMPKTDAGIGAFCVAINALHFDGATGRLVSEDEARKLSLNSEEARVSFENFIAANRSLIFGSSD